MQLTIEQLDTKITSEMSDFIWLVRKLDDTDRDKGYFANVMVKNQIKGSVIRDKFTGRVLNPTILNETFTATASTPADALLKAYLSAKVAYELGVHESTSAGR